jgi:low affinity Fe/Cu permease
MRAMLIEDAPLVNPFCNLFANLAEPKQNIKFNEEHDRQVKTDAELIINICENSSVTIQPVTPTEISKLVATIKKKKAEDIDNLTAEHLLIEITVIPL